MGNHEVAGYSGAQPFSRWDDPAPLHSSCHKILKPWPISLTSLVATFIKVAAYIYKPISGHLSIHGCLTNLRNKP